MNRKKEIELLNMYVLTMEILPMQKPADHRKGQINTIQSVIFFPKNPVPFDRNNRCIN